MEYNIGQAECEGVPIKGRLDKVSINQNHVHVIDFKTGKYANARDKLKPPSEKLPNGGDYWRQIVYYCILIESDPNNQWRFDKGSFDFVQPDKTTGKFHFSSFDVSSEELTIVKDQIQTTYKSILAHEFEKGCNEEDCMWCNFVKFNELDMSNRQIDDDESDGFELSEGQEID
jgi:DNA helicase-2/ATP-dependent DNA helicase PcrA